jgi:hypothetical protein
MGFFKSLAAVESVDVGALREPLPDVLLPSQFFDTQTFSSEQRLMLAILANVVNVLREYRVSPNHNKRDAFDEASCWVFVNGIASSLSFDHVCDALGIDAGTCEGACRNWSQIPAAICVN